MSNEAPESTQPELSPEDTLLKNLEKRFDTKGAPEEAEVEEVSTAEAATRTDNNDRDPLSEQLEAAQEEDDTEVEEDEGDEEAEPEEDTEEEDEEPEEPEEDDEDDEPVEIDEDTVVFTTPEGEEVTLRELKRGFLREADYTKKTQEVAEQRQQVQQAIQAVEQHNQTLAEHLEVALSVLEPSLASLASTNWDELATSDPYEYAEKRAQFDIAQQKYQQLMQASQQVVTESQQVAQARKKQMLAQEQQKLAMALPDFADPKKGKELATKLRDYALQSGLSEQEASNISDHRLIVMMNKARQFDEMSKSGLELAKKKISKAPKKLTSAGRQSSKADRRNQQRVAARDKVRRSGSVDDAVAALLGGG